MTKKRHLGLADMYGKAGVNYEPASQAYRVTRDGVEKMVGTHNECFGYILKHQGQSVDWACRYEGWKIEPVESLP